MFQLGPYTFKPAQKMLVDEEEKKIRLTEKETNILKFLYRASEGVVARDILLHEVWGYNAGVTTHTLETHIYRLRQKIEPDPSNARLLVTESGGVSPRRLKVPALRPGYDADSSLLDWPGHCAGPFFIPAYRPSDTVGRDLSRRHDPQD